MPTAAELSQYLNIGFIVLFFLAIVGLLLAALIGYKRGVFASTFRFVFMLILIGTTIFTLDGLTDFVGSFNLEGLISYKTIELVSTTNSSNLVYYVKVTSIKETLYECFKGWYLIHYMNGDYAAASSFAFSFAGGVLKYAVFFVSMILIVTLGNLFGWILWHLVFKHVIPKFARIKVKLRLISTIEQVAKFSVSMFMVAAPLSSIVNTIVSSIQGVTDIDDDDASEYVKLAQTFVNSYNDSIFAQTFINWTLDDKGLSLDTQFINYITKTVTEDGEISLLDIIYDIGDLAVQVAQGVVFDENGQIVMADTIQAATGCLSGIFESISNSKIVTVILPIAAEIALNLDAVTEYVDPSLIQLDDVEWSAEVSNLQSMLQNILDTGILNKFIDSTTGEFSAPSDISEILKFLLDIPEGSEPIAEENKVFPKLLKVFDNLKNSKVFSRALPSVVYYLVKSNAQVGEYLPNTIEELTNIDWAFELKTVLQNLYSLKDSCPSLFDGIIDMLAPSSSTNPGTSGLKPYKEGTGEPSGEPEESSGGVMDLIPLALENIDGLVSTLIGEVDSDYNIVNVDANGRTKVWDDNGNRIQNKNYTLFDLNIAEKALKKVINMLPDFMGASDAAKADLNDLVAYYEQQGWRVNYKHDFATLFFALEPFGDDPTLLSAILGGSLDLSTMTDEQLDSLGEVLTRLDKSPLGCCILDDTLFNVLQPTVSSFSSLGLNPDIIIGTQADADSPYTGGSFQALQKKENHYVGHSLGSELAKFLKVMADITELQNRLGGTADIATIMYGGSYASETDATKKALASGDQILTRILNTLYESKLINPDVGSVKNTNFYGLFSYVFESVNMNGLEFKKTIIEAKEGLTWAASFDEDGLYKAGGEIVGFAKFVKAVADSSAVEYLSDLSSNIANIKAEKTVQNLLAAVDESYVAKVTLGEYLDITIGNIGLDLIDASKGISFTNIDTEVSDSWTKEGVKLQRIIELLDSVDLSGGIDITSINADTIPALDDLLHSLADSGIFVHKTTADPSQTVYLFGNWIKKTIKEALGGISIGGSSGDIIADPSSMWANPSTAEYTIFDNSFAELDSKSDWIVSNYAYGQFEGNDPITSSPNINKLINFTDDSELDEINKISRVIYYGAKVAGSSATSLTELDANDIKGLLDSFNTSSTLYVCVHGVYNLAKTSLGTDGILNLTNADIDYLASSTTTTSDRATEIGYFSDLFDIFGQLETSGVIAGGSFDITKLESGSQLFEDLENTVLGLNRSKVFHQNGPKNIDATKNWQPTVFESLIETMLGNDEFASILYNESSPKITHLKTTNAKYQGFAEDLSVETSSKAYARYIIDKAFYYENDDSDQEDTIDSIFSVVDKYLVFNESLGSGSIDNVELDSLDKDAVIDLLQAMNNSDIFYDAVPNTFNKMFIQNTGIGAALGSDVTFSTANPYYIYNVSSGYGWEDDRTASFENRYPSEEIEQVGKIIDAYSSFSTLKGDNGLSNAKTVYDLTLGEGDDFEKSALYKVFEAFYNSDMFHKEHINLATSYSSDMNNEDNTVFEQLVFMTINSGGLNGVVNQYYDLSSTDSVKITEKIKLLTISDLGNSAGYEGYNFNWLVDSNPDESGVYSLVYFCNDCASIIMSKAADPNNAVMDASSLEISNYSGEQISDLLTDCNNADVLSDVVPALIKNAYITMGLGGDSSNDGKTTYHFTYQVGGVTPNKETACYGLSQNEFAGSDGEIALLARLIDAMKNPLTGEYYDLSSDSGITDFSNSADGLPALFNYVYNSKILNKVEYGTNTYYSNSDLNFKASSLFMYNIFNSVEIGSDTLAKYITGSAQDEKIIAISKLLEFNQAGVDAQDEIEAVGFSSLVNSKSSIQSASTGDITTASEAITTLMKKSYNATNVSNASDYKRSYFVSHIVSNILNDKFTGASGEEGLITTNGYDTYYQKTLFGPTSDMFLSETTASLQGMYENGYTPSTGDIKHILAIDVTETTGVEGAISMTNIALPSDLADLTDSACAEIKESISEGFAQMGESYVAKLLYLSRIHNIILQLYPASWREPCTEVKTLDNLYNASYDFNVRGQAICSDPNNVLNTNYLYLMLMD